MRNALKFIDSLPKHQVKKQIFDVDYRHLMDNPVEAVKEIYQHFGLKYTEQFEHNMKVVLLSLVSSTNILGMVEREPPREARKAPVLTGRVWPH